jgi:hypothetical protein
MVGIGLSSTNIGLVPYYFITKAFCIFPSILKYLILLIKRFFGWYQIYFKNKNNKQYVKLSNTHNHKAHFSPKMIANMKIITTKTFITLSAKGLLACWSAASKWITACFVWVRVD